MSQTPEQDRRLQTAMLEMAQAAGMTEEEFHAMRAALEKGATLADVFNIGKDALESGYALGYNLYKSGNYKDAETMFRGLCMYDGNDPRFWMGLAGCLQAREAFREAVEAYEIAGASSGLKDPAPFYHAGLCLLKLGNTEGAEAAFNAVLTFGDAANPAHKSLQDRARAVMASQSRADGQAQGERA